MLLHQYENDKIILRPLTTEDAEAYFRIYTDAGTIESYAENPVLPGETAEAFTERIASLCICNFTMRPVEAPERIIGDCALHHWNRDAHEMEMGGALLSAYWGRGLMASAFSLLMDIATKEFGVKRIVVRTEPDNHKAIRLAEKMGFGRSGQEAVFSKTI